jgi:hypothetical protein
MPKSKKGGMLRPRHQTEATIEQEHEIYVEGARQEDVTQNKKQRWNWSRGTRQYKGTRSPCERHESRQIESGSEAVLRPWAPSPPPFSLYQI